MKEPKKSPKAGEIHLDWFEVRMLDRLQRSGRMPTTELAAAVGLSATPCARRLEAMMESGVIEGFGARLDRRKIGLSVEVFVLVRLISHSDQSPDRFVTKVEAMEPVIACWALTGDHDFMLHAVLPDVEALNRFIAEDLMRIEGVRDVRTNLVLRNIKGPEPLPLSHLAE
ncbi:ArsR family transcriptional regulator [Rhizobium albus]|nr:ArsR family transcriptional regulator [Rhizobium albus]